MKPVRSGCDMLKILVDILLIITRTDCRNLESVLRVAENYYLEGNPYATMSKNYSFEESDTDLFNIRDEMKGQCNTLKYLLTLK